MELFCLGDASLLCCFLTQPLALTCMERRRWCWSADPTVLCFRSWLRGSLQPLGPLAYSPAFGLPGLCVAVLWPYKPLQALLCASCPSPGMSYALDNARSLGWTIALESQTWAPGVSLLLDPHS